MRESKAAYASCECSSPNHVFKLAMERWEGETPSATVELSVHLSHFLPWWRRIGRAAKYVLGVKSHDTDWDSVLLRRTDAESMLVLLNEYLAELDSPGVSPPPSKR